MSETTTLAERAPQNGGLSLTAEKLELIRRTLAPDLTNDELALFGEMSKRVGLDPIRRQIYAVKRGGRVTFQTSIDGFRVIAERSGKYRGQLAAQWCGPDGNWVDVWLQPKPPAAARVAVLRSDFSEPMWAVARWDSYAQDQGGMWKKMPEHMLAKCAEALAIRKAFPDETAGLYSDEEMAQADGPTPKAPPRKAQGSDKRQQVNNTTSPGGAAIQPDVVAETPASSERKVPVHPVGNAETGEVGDIDILFWLGETLPKNRQSRAQIEQLVEAHGYATIYRRLVTNHKLNCGLACPHLDSSGQPESD